MARFGINGIYNEELSFFGRLAFFIHGNPHIAKFLQSHYFIKNTNKIISREIRNVLDVGCGSGDYSFFLAEKYPWLKINSIDSDDKNIENATEIKGIKQHKEVNFICAYFQSSGIKKQHDLVFCVETLHAINNKTIFLRKISELMKKGGILYFQDCMKEDYHKMILNCPPNQFNLYRNKFFAGNQLSAGELLEILKKLNFEILKNGRIIGFFGQLAWEIDQISAVNIKYLKTLLIPVLKTLCKLDFLLNLGRKNELFVVARKIK